MFRKLQFGTTVLLLMAVVIVGCKKEEKFNPTPYILDLKLGFPAPNIDPNNPLTEESIALGKALFYDTRLSSDNTISCASCHKAEFAFADNLDISPGVKGRLGKRNAPSIVNLAFAPFLNTDGGVPRLEVQPNVPIEDENEMDFHVLRISDRLNADEKYLELAAKAYDSDINPYVITRSLANFMRIFISDDSRYDRYLVEEGFNLTKQEADGMALFFGKAKCSECHYGHNFTNYTFTNNGAKAEYEDVGRAGVTIKQEDRFLYRVPTLRNAELTAPYMHDGSIATLEDVLVSYGFGGHNHPKKDPIISSIHLSSSEQAQIIAFIKTLTDESFIHNPELIQ